MRFKTILALTISAALLTTNAFAHSHAIDSSKSSVKFTIKNKPPGRPAFTDVPGSFSDFAGTFSIENNPNQCSVKMVIKTTSVDTGNKKRDDHLRNPDFFKVKEFPTMSFTSTKWKKTGKDTYDVTGNFTPLEKPNRSPLASRQTVTPAAQLSSGSNAATTA